jgi:hypothetical protein
MFHEATSGEHTPDAALGEAMTWLGRTPDGMADVIMLTLPGRLRKQQELDMYAELYRVLDSDTGSLWIWGAAAGLLGSRFECQLVYEDLTHAWTSWDRPRLDPELPLPSFGGMSREMPPSVIEYCLRAAAGPSRLVIDVFPRAPHVAQSVGREIGARVLTVAPVADLYTAPHTSPPHWVHSRTFHDWFFNRLEKQGNCLIYPSKPHASGYARLRIAGREYYAHHVSWMLSHRRVVPQGIPVLHASCPDRRCCTPGHLRLGSVEVNLDERWLGRRAKG